MSRRRTENRGQTRKAREAAKQRQWRRIMDVPSTRGEGDGPIYVNGASYFDRQAPDDQPEATR